VLLRASVRVPVERVSSIGGLIVMRLLPLINVHVAGLHLCDGDHAWSVRGEAFGARPRLLFV